MAGNAIFVHDPGGYSLAEPGSVVALSANAIEACHRAGVASCVLDDLTSRPDICRRPDAYLRWQLDWLKRLDAASQLNGVVQACANLIIPPVDSLVITSRMLAGAVEALAPEGITYVGRTGPVESTEYHNGHLQFWPALGDTPLAARLLPLIAEARSLSFAAHAVDGRITSSVPAPSAIARLRRHLSRSVGPYRRAYRRRWAGRAQRRSTLLLWYAGYGVRQFARDERAAGRDTTFITRGGSSFHVIDPGMPPRRGRSRRIDMAVPPASELAPALVAMLDEIDEWTGVPGAARILESRLSLFLRGICFTVSEAASRAMREFSLYGIERVAAANPSSLEEFACLIAARNVHLPRVLLQHGDHLLRYDSWLVTETQNFEELAASDPTMDDDLRAAGARLGVTPPRVTNYSPRTTALHEDARSKGGTACHENAVCYVPAFLLGDSRSINGCNFDDAWYHRWHLRVLDLMSSRPDLRFVWKGLPSSDQAVDPVPSIIAERRLDNVAYESLPFLKVVSGVNRVFTDFPSTALYESVHLGKPVLALTFPRFFSIRPSAAARFAPVLRECDDEDEALRHIRGFIDADPTPWVLPQQILASP
jgi:hypothetical protein